MRDRGPGEVVCELIGGQVGGEAGTHGLRFLCTWEKGKSSRRVVTGSRGVGKTIVNFLFCLLKVEISVSLWPEWTDREMFPIVEREGMLGSTRQGLLSLVNLLR